MSWAVGVDIGGTGIKAGLVDAATGRMAVGQVRVTTPSPSLAPAVAQAVEEACALLDAKLRDRPASQEQPEAGGSEKLGSVPENTCGLPVGIAFPGSIRDGTVIFLGNLDQSWIGTDIARVFSPSMSSRCLFLNDADAAGVAEMAFGAGRDAHNSTVALTTLGTGIGTALFTGGRLYPYTELGHITVDGQIGEKLASVKTKDALDLSFEDWALRLQAYYSQLILLTNPDLIIVGGWISTQHEKFLPLLDLPTPVVPAHFTADSGIIGAALVAAHGDLHIEV